MTPGQLAQRLKQKARQLGFGLVGIASPGTPAHVDVFEAWLQAGRQAEMDYLAQARAVQRRADPALILPEYRCVLVLGIPYFNPQTAATRSPGEAVGRVAAYAWGDDYHLVLPQRLQALVTFLEEQSGSPVPNRWYTDTGPVLERELAVRAGLGWIGKNTCLISPQQGSYFLLAEIFLGIDLPCDQPFSSDQCGSCTRCVQACPTQCIRADRTLDARRCISYLTIENKFDIPEDLRPLMGDWVFGCDICQMVCPWNIRFAHRAGDPAFAPRPGLPTPLLEQELALTPQEFNFKYKNSPLKRAKRRGYLRNIAVAAGNHAQSTLLPALQAAQLDDEPLLKTHAQWAIRQLEDKMDR